MPGHESVTVMHGLSLLPWDTCWNTLDLFQVWVFTQETLSTEGKLLLDLFVVAYTNRPIGHSSFDFFLQKVIEGNLINPLSVIKNLKKDDFKWWLVENR